MATTTRLVSVLLLLCFVPRTVAKNLRVRCLMQMNSRRFDDVPRTGLYQNPCTGSWSNDEEVTNIDDCENYGNDGVVGGSSGNGGDRDTTDEVLDCNIATADDPTSPEMIYPVEYWYGVKSTSNDTDWLPVIEEKIYNVATGRINDCLGYTALRRQLQEPTARRLGILSSTSAPADAIRDDVRMPAAYVDGEQERFVVQGQFQILARENDDLNKTLQSMHDAIEDSMNDNGLIGEDIPNVTKVIYLGTSQQDVENQYISPPVVSPPVLPAGNNNVQEDDDNDGFVPVVLAASAAGLVALLVLLVWRKNHHAVAAREMDAHSIAMLDDDGEAFTPLPGTGDPPGAFHRGVYHHMPGGQEYLSTNCYDCHETRSLSNNDHGDVLPSVIVCISDEEEDNYRNLTVANSKDIAGKAWSMNVHDCASATCKLCRPFQKNVEMLPIQQKDSAEGLIDSNEEPENFGIRAEL